MGLGQRSIPKHYHPKESVAEGAEMVSEWQGEEKKGSELSPSLFWKH